MISLLPTLAFLALAQGAHTNGGPGGGGTPPSGNNLGLPWDAYPPVSGSLDGPASVAVPATDGGKGPLFTMTLTMADSDLFKVNLGSGDTYQTEGTAAWLNYIEFDSTGQVMGTNGLIQVLELFNVTQTGNYPDHIVLGFNYKPLYRAGLTYPVTTTMKYQIYDTTPAPPSTDPNSKIHDANNPVFTKDLTVGLG